MEWLQEESMPGPREVFAPVEARTLLSGRYRSTSHVPEGAAGALYCVWEERREDERFFGIPSAAHALSRERRAGFRRFTELGLVGRAGWTEAPLQEILERAGRGGRRGED
ncbi:hypothetical protein Rxyl_2284 [Rubrobacter xylanophilus DSM 9941]|uniref:Uncharacterized protein n=1 Tax=Rubrobacter xylanophilus (strain DSM 9941 / JCM 11954 / NBRC 16129 / PRD-1) TaxID=266117 RepID=Q1ATR4_RUBXD|nr:hypothetical protein Rxyl_2284 [Rubrobacter xylanophilus DSM 9941]